ncbi:MAG TPA: hypothetical protein VMZ51_05140 [Acidimicrobiales bacterium]|nr:hypothetical protein [Acidimicrobiales bacterium]
MAAPKRLTNLIDYAAILPYASEMFGVYQPLIGWKSKRAEARFNAGFDRDRSAMFGALRAQFAGLVKTAYGEGCKVAVSIAPGVAAGGSLRGFDSVVMERIAERLPAGRAVAANQWKKFVNKDVVEKIMKDSVVPEYSAAYEKACRGVSGGGTERVHAPGRKTDVETLRLGFEAQLRYESSVAGALLHLTADGQADTLAEMFFSTKDNTGASQALTRMLAATGPIDGYLDLTNLNPRDRSDLERVALSPISVVHLFRQYFFELDSFLGTPVSHVWLSPGSTVELIEVQTRRSLVEKMVEQATETTQRAETDTTTQEEISDAVKEENREDVKFGASVSASYASIVANSSFDYSTGQQRSREETHKRMRQQTEKLSTEIRKSFKSTFRTVTETTDSSSKRYVLTNTTNQLVNYELRRKMRQVAVQVQDIGTYLCWQTYVDNPGDSLGVARLVHIGKPPDLDGLHAPEEIPMLQPFAEEKIVTIPFISVDDTDADNEGEVYKDGVEVDDSEWFGNLEKIQADFPIDVVCSRSSYRLAEVEFDGSGKPVTASRRGDIVNTSDRARFTLHLDSADFQGQNSLQIKLTLHWTPAPGANDEVIAQNQANTAAFHAKEAAEYEKAFLENAKDRIKLTHEIRQRSGEEMREEERIVVYRKLIQDMLTAGVSMPDDRTRHIVAELINSVFDIDKMLYFVAPEWWRPRLRKQTQQLSPTTRPPIKVGDRPKAIDAGFGRKVFGASVAAAPPSPLTTSTVGWGGIDDPNRDSYYITSDSEPARFGSSLGWLLQLDGDNMRNAFLNAPWVKAVIPIRPGKEEAAINWLKGVEGFNGITNADIYRTNNPDEKDVNGNPLDGQRMIDVILDLAHKIQRKHAEGVAQGTFPKASEVADPQLVDAENVVTSTPIDRVYEHGFFPLENSFRANVTGNYEIFDQWLEILPTDQVVPVEVRYDPKTGRQV